MEIGNNDEYKEYDKNKVEDLLAPIRAMIFSENTFFLSKFYNYICTNMENVKYSRKRIFNNILQ